MQSQCILVGHVSEGKNVDKDGVVVTPKCSWHEKIPHIGIIPGEKNIFSEVRGSFGLQAADVNSQADRCQQFSGCANIPAKEDI